MGIEDQRLYARYDLNRTLLSNLRLELARDGLEILHDCVPFLALKTRQLHLVDRAKEIHVEPGPHSFIDRRSAHWTSLRYDIIRVHFVPDVAPLQHAMNVRFANIGCHA